MLIEWTVWSIRITNVFTLDRSLDQPLIKLTNRYLNKTKEEDEWCEEREFKKSKKKQQKKEEKKLFLTEESGWGGSVQAATHTHSITHWLASAVSLI